MTLPRHILLIAREHQFRIVAECAELMHIEEKQLNLQLYRPLGAFIA
jgi:hypothetical protein